MRAIQKIIRQGSSSMITLPRPLMFALKLLPGDFVEISTQEDGTARITPWETRDRIAAKSPGVIPETNPVLKP